LPDGRECQIVAEVEVHVALKIAIYDVGIAPAGQLVTFVELLTGRFDAPLPLLIDTAMLGP